MAKYWVHGTDNWSDNTNHWSASSGGSPGATLPTSSDDVVIDSNSGFGGGGTITIDVFTSMNNFLANSGHTYTIFTSESLPLAIYGSVILEAGITLTDVWIDLYAPSGNKTITTAGVVLPNFRATNGSGSTATWTLQDDLVTTGQFDWEYGTFDANDHNVTANDFYFYADTGYTPTVIMGSGTWEGNSFYIDQNNSEVVTFTPETSTIKLVGADPYITIVVGDSYPPYASAEFYNLWVGGTGIAAILGDLTLNDLKIDAGVSIIFSAGSTQDITSFTALGTLGNLITLNNYNGIDQFTLSKSSGIVSCDYLNISNSNAEGGATWYAGSHSVDGGNNTGWLFQDPKYIQGISTITGINTITF